MGIQSADIPRELNDLSEQIIGAAIEVHRTLGPGLLEGIYEEALVRELELRKIAIQRQLELPLEYKGVILRGQRIDLLVERQVIVELKAVEAIASVHLAQLLSYLRAADLHLGLLINFHCDRLVDGVRRRINSRASGQSRILSVPSARPPRPLR